MYDRIIALMALMASPASAEILRPYALDVGHTVTVHGHLHCPLYAGYCELTKNGERFSRNALDVSLNGLDDNQRGHLTAQCGQYACQVSVTGRVVKGVNSPYVVAQTVQPL